MVTVAVIGLAPFVTWICFMVLPLGALIMACGILDLRKTLKIHPRPLGSLVMAFLWIAAGLALIVLLLYPLLPR
jgi:hypothetical protein